MVYTASALLLCAWASLRSIDLQRCIIQKIHRKKRTMTVLILSQKNPDLGDLAPPIEFMIPIKGIHVDFWATPLEADINTDFVMPSLSHSLLHPDCSPLWDEKLELPKSNKVIEQLFAFPVNGIDLSNEHRLTSRSYRRFLATIADLCDLSEPRSELLGRWRMTRKRDSSMPRVYANDRLRSTTQTILALHLVLLKALKRSGNNLSVDGISPGDLELVSVNQFLDMSVDSIPSIVVKVPGLAQYCQSSDSTPTLNPPQKKGKKPDPPCTNDIQSTEEGEYDSGSVYSPSIQSEDSDWDDK